MRHRLRYAVAIAVVAVFFSDAVYVHQRSNDRYCHKPNFPRIHYLCYVGHHPWWQDPAAVVIAIGGLVLAAGILTGRRKPS
jgi:hypothetical protein